MEKDKREVIKDDIMQHFLINWSDGLCFSFSLGLWMV